MLFEWLIQFGPVVLFFLAFELTGENFFTATVVLIMATIGSVIGGFLHDKQFPLFPMVGALFVSVFGGATLVFRDPQFLMIKDTVSDAVMGMGLLLALYCRRNVLKLFFSPLFALREKGWRVLAFRWGIFLLLSAVMNEFVRHFFPTDIWVRYKLTSTFALFFFAVLQVILLRKERLPHASNRFGMRISK